MSKELQKIRGVGVVTAQRLAEAGFTEIDHVAEAAVELLRELTGLYEARAVAIRAAARELQTDGADEPILDATPVAQTPDTPVAAAEPAEATSKTKTEKKTKGKKMAKKKAAKAARKLKAKAKALADAAKKAKKKGKKSKAKKLKAASKKAARKAKKAKKK